jgi:8-oxo-dGTP diphosphatase
MGVVSDAVGRILLVRTPHRGWEPPGGQVERGEDLLAALAREIAEESGCQVEPGRLVGVYANVGPLGIVMFTFLCQHTGGELCAGHECLDAGWFSPGEALHLVTNSAQAAKLHDALAAREPGGVIYCAYQIAHRVESGTRRYTDYVVTRERRC